MARRKAEVEVERVNLTQVGVIDTGSELALVGMGPSTS